LLLQFHQSVAVLGGFAASARTLLPLLLQFHQSVAVLGGFAASARTLLPLPLQFHQSVVLLGLCENRYYRSTSAVELVW
jgi:hypothetical protein